MTGFRAWLRKQTRRDDRIGDIARDFEDDVRRKCMPGVHSPYGILSHIEGMHDASGRAVEAFQAAEQEWRQTQ